MNVSLITIAVIVLIASILPQGFAYIYIRRKEKIQEYKNINQELILPYLNDVILFIEKETDYLHGSEIRINPDKIISNIQGRIGFGDSRLINALYRYRNSISYFNGKGEAKNIATYEVFYFFLEHAYDCLVKSRYKDDFLIDLILKNQKIYGIAFVLTTLIGREEALKILSHKTLWTSKFLDKISFGLLEDLIKNYNHSKMEEHKLLMFLSTLKSVLFESSDTDRLSDVKEYIEEAIVIVQDRWVNYSG